MKFEKITHFLSSFEYIYANSMFLFVFLFLFQLMFIFQGLDVTDTGYHLTNQVLAYHGHTDMVQFSIFLTDYIGGWWLNLYGQPNIVWARLGSILIFCLTALLSYFTLSPFFTQNKVFYVIIVSTLLITMTIPNVIIEYYSFPALLLNLGLFLVSKIFINSHDKNRTLLLSFFLGFLAIPIILSRFPLVTISIIPFIVIIYSRITQNRIIGLKEMGIGILAGVLCGTILFLILYKLLGILDSLCEDIRYMVFSLFERIDVHDLNTKKYKSSLLQRDYGKLVTFYIRDAGIALIYAIASVGAFSVVAFFKEKFSRFIQPFSMNLLIMLILGSLFLACRFLLNLHTDMIILFLMDYILIIGALYLIYQPKHDNTLSFLLISSICVMLVTPLGSDTGLWKVVYGMWIALPLSFLLSYDLYNKVDNITIRRFLSLNTALILLLLSISFYVHYRNVFRDDLNRLQLNTRFEFKYLTNLYSHKERVKAVDEVLTQVTSLTQKDDKVLMIDRIFMFYYLTETKPVWALFPLASKSKHDIDKLIEDLTIKSSYPKILVLSKVDVRTNDWPEGPASKHFRSDEYAITQYVIDRFVNQLNYAAIWENNAFRIYKKSEL